MRKESSTSLDGHVRCWDAFVRIRDGRYRLFSEDLAPRTVDFRSQMEAARHVINEWVEAKTREKIQELIRRGTLGPDPRLIVVNAVHFKGTWVLPFSKSSTREEPFYAADGGNVRVPLMRQQEGFPYLHADGFQGGGFVLPRRRPLHARSPSGSEGWASGLRGFGASGPRA